DFLKQYGDFENGIPVHDTIARVVSCISPAKFHECFINWMRDCCVFRSIRSRIGIEVRSAIRIHSINRELNFFYRFLTRFFAAFH
ncbi:transposase family protein, partial [Escherichia coli]|uniref:transposase family protein n=1 Tax=Escherichia coli TaxID=562 RepID=UPI00204090B2